MWGALFLGYLLGSDTNITIRESKPEPKRKPIRLTPSEKKHAEHVNSCKHCQMNEVFTSEMHSIFY